MDDEPPRKQLKQATRDSEEVSSIEWQLIKMTDQEEDLIYRMHKLVGGRLEITTSRSSTGHKKIVAITISREQRWELIAGRIPGRKAAEIERFWMMKHDKAFP